MVRTHLKLRSFKSTRTLTTSVLTTITSQEPDESIVVDDKYEIGEEPLTTVKPASVEIGLAETVIPCAYTRFQTVVSGQKLSYMRVMPKHESDCEIRADFLY